MALLTDATVTNVLIALAITLSLVGPAYVGFGYGPTSRRRAEAARGVRTVD